MSIENEEPGTPKQKEAWGHRHGITMIMLVLAMLLALVILVQMTS